MAMFAGRVIRKRTGVPSFATADMVAPCKGVSLFERFTDALAETDDIGAASAAARVPLEIGQAFYNRLCREAGEQAQ